MNEGGFDSAFSLSRSGRCRGPVRTWDMAGRTVYCCARCQPLNGALAAGRAEKMNGARTHKEFQSAPRTQ